jgi:hypothetical protein
VVACFQWHNRVVEDPRATVSAALAVLAAATSVELGPVGVAARVTPAYRAYQALIRDPAALAAERPALERMLAAPSPAARFYAALLLRRLDPAVGQAALQAMVSSTEPLSVAPGGCVIMPTRTLGAAAQSFLSPPGILGS